MSDNIISYIDMCRTEGAALQHGMNFRLRGRHSVTLMSVQANAPYRVRITDGGTTLIYEGHDMPKTADCPSPKSVDQPLKTRTGRPTPNGKFFEAALAAKRGAHPPERVRVYEKIRVGIWAYNGLFNLVDAWTESDGTRSVCKFKLVAIEDDGESPAIVQPVSERRRIIPSAVKLEVWQRDGGKCAICGATDELHFDHVVPFLKGGTSLTPANVQLLCARHNIAKRDRIE